KGGSCVLCPLSPSPSIPMSPQGLGGITYVALQTQHSSWRCRHEARSDRRSPVECALCPARAGTPQQLGVMGCIYVYGRYTLGNSST
ncbi:hypothetical protein NHX12_029158, partial [Muraenolepis orangiensis]